MRGYGNARRYQRQAQAASIAAARVSTVSAQATAEEAVGAAINLEGSNALTNKLADLEERLGALEEPAP